MQVIAKEDGGVEIKLGEDTLLKQHLRCGDWDQVSKEGRAEAFFDLDSKGNQPACLSSNIKTWLVVL